VEVSYVSLQPRVYGHRGVAQVKNSLVLHPYLSVNLPSGVASNTFCVITIHQIISCANGWWLGPRLWTQRVRLIWLLHLKWGFLGFEGARFAA
jgi:hypothetical protein